MKTAVSTGTLHYDPATGRWYVHTRDTGSVDLADRIQTKPDRETADTAEVEATIEGTPGIGGRGYTVVDYHFI